MGKILAMQFSDEHWGKCKAWFKRKSYSAQVKLEPDATPIEPKTSKPKLTIVQKASWRLFSFDWNFFLWKLLSLFQPKVSLCLIETWLKKGPKARRKKIELVKIEITGADLVEHLIKILGLKPNRSSWLVLLLFLSGRFFPNSLIQLRKGFGLKY